MAICWTGARKLQLSVDEGIGLSEIQIGRKSMSSIIISDMKGQARKAEGTRQTEAYEHLTLSTLFPTHGKRIKHTRQMDKTETISKHPEVVP